MYKFDFQDPSLRKYIGSLSQVAGIKHFEFKEGRAKGVEAYEVRTGAGLSYTVLADRCLDIAWAEFRGIPFGYVSDIGVVAPQYFEPEEFGYLRSFTVGLLSTCGMTYMGAPCIDEGQELGLHGRVGNLPAEEVSAVSDGDGGNVLRIQGKVREARFFRENLVLRRTIESRLGENKIRISDRIRNEGFDHQPLMMLYHFNFGYPLLQESTEMVAPVRKVTARDPRAEEGIDTYYEIESPQHAYDEQVFYLDLAPDSDGWTTIGLVNRGLGFGVYERFRKDQLPILIEWKQMGEGYYVMGLEPANCYPEGRAKERARGALPYINPGETKEFNLEIGILEGEKEIDKFAESVRSLV